MIKLLRRMEQVSLPRAGRCTLAFVRAVFIAVLVTLAVGLGPTTAVLCQAACTHRVEQPTKAPICHSSNAATGGLHFVAASNLPDHCAVAVSIATKPRAATLVVFSIAIRALPTTRVSVEGSVRHPAAAGAPVKLPTSALAFALRI